VLCVSPTCYVEVTRKLATFRPSHQVREEVTRKLTTSRGSYEEPVSVEFGLIETNRLRQCTADSGSVGHGSGVRWVNKSVTHGPMTH